jgi:hypothetical protein
MRTGAWTRIISIHDIYIHLCLVASHLRYIAGLTTVVSLVVCTNTTEMRDIVLLNNNSMSAMSSFWGKFAIKGIVATGIKTLVWFTLYWAQDSCILDDDLKLNN